MTAAVFTSISRSSVVGLVTGAAIVALMAPLRKATRIAGVLFAAVAGIFLIRPGLATSLILSVTQAGDEISIQTRSYSAGFALKQFAGADWLLGLSRSGLPPLDNQFLTSLAEGGIAGAAVLLLRYLLTLNAGIFVLRTQRDDLIRRVVGGLLTAAVVTLIVAVALDVTSFDQVWFTTLLVAGLLGAAQTQVRLADDTPVAPARGVPERPEVTGP